MPAQEPNKHRHNAPVQQDYWGPSYPVVQSCWGILPVEVKAQHHCQHDSEKCRAGGGHQEAFGDLRSGDFYRMKFGELKSADREPSCKSGN